MQWQLHLNGLELMISQTNSTDLQNKKKACSAQVFLLHTGSLDDMNTKNLEPKFED